MNQSLKYDIVYIKLFNMFSTMSSNRHMKSTTNFFVLKNSY